MAKHWFTVNPDNYFMRQSRRGGRRELLFTFAGKRPCNPTSTRIRALLPFRPSATVLLPAWSGEPLVPHTRQQPALDALIASHIAQKILKYFNYY